MTPPMAAWRVTYTPGEWLVLSGPTMLVVMLPAPPRMSGLLNTLWDDILNASSVDALLQIFAQYGLDGMPDFAAFFWDEAGLHGLARGQLDVVDADTGETVVSGTDVVTWREESLGAMRRLRVGMQPVNPDEHLQLPLVVGAVMASAIHLSTHQASLVHFPDDAYRVSPATKEAPASPTGAHADAAEKEVPGATDGTDVPVEVVGLGDESEMEPFFEPEPEPDPELEPEPESEPELEPEPSTEQESQPEAQPEPERDDDVVEGRSGADSEDADAESIGVGALRFDADESAPSLAAPSATVATPPVATPPAVAPPIPPPMSAPVVVPRTFQVGDDDDDGGTVFSTNLAATHKPAAEPEEQSQVLAVPCARGHANPPGSRGCRICSAPVDSSRPVLINRPALAGVHSNKGEFADVHVAVLVGRSPDASKAPPGAHLLRVPSPSSDISRSHLIVTPRDWSVIVTDLDSTNGTTVIPVGEQAFVLANGESVQVDMGTVLDLGDGVSLRIEPPRG